MDLHVFSLNNAYQLSHKNFRQRRLPRVNRMISPKVEIATGVPANHGSPGPASRRAGGAPYSWIVSVMPVIKLERDRGKVQGENFRACYV